MEKEDEKHDTYFDPTELKAHLKIFPPNGRHKVKDFERLKHLANGQNLNAGMSEIDMVVKNQEEEERENKNQPEPENWTNSKNYLKKNCLYIVKGCDVLIKTVDVVRKND